MSEGAARDGRDRPTREHRAAVAAFLESAALVPAERWHRSPGEGRWSPAQIAEHVALSADALLAELAGGPPLRVRVGPVMERLLRWLLLPHILHHRSLPLRARSPRELRPAGAGLDPERVAPRLRAAAERLERELRASSRARVTHPYFGPIPLQRALRLLAVHTEHHRRQLESAGLPPAG